MYNNSSPPASHGYPNQYAPAEPPAGYPSNVPPADYDVRYTQGPPQQSYLQVPQPIYQPSAPTSATSSVHGSSHGNHPAAPPAMNLGVPTAYPIDTYTISQFLNDTQSGAGSCPFEVDTTRPAMLQVNFGCKSTAGEMLQQIYMKKGSMVAYKGEIKFSREGVMEHGISNTFKKAVGSERASLVKATWSGQNGSAQLYVADNNKIISVFQLQGESISVNGEDLLAFEPSLEHKIVIMKKLSAIVSGGLFNVKLSGKGCVAILSHGKPLTLIVKRGNPIVYTDPEATVAWSGNLNPDFNTDMQLKTLIGRGSGESFQMKFDPKNGEGFVVIQPSEEIVSSRSSFSAAMLR